MRPSMRRLNCEQDKQSPRLTLYFRSSRLIPTFEFCSSHEYGRRTNPILLLCAVAVIFSGALSAYAQQPQPEDLQQQLQQLKQQYEETTQQLQNRITALEQQIEKQKESSSKANDAAISTAQLAEETAKKDLLGQSDQVG